MKINEYQIKFDRDTGMYVGFCPELKVYSQGRTKEEAREACINTPTDQLPS